MQKNIKNGQIYRLQKIQILLKFQMFKVCRQATNILMSSYDETALISGISDIIVVQWDKQNYKSTPFLACFGSLAVKAKQEQIKLYINDKQIENVKFEINKYGYIEPLYPEQSVLRKLSLAHGKNKIKFETSRKILEAQIYLFDLKDKIIISDLDGTMTKTDIMGIVSNYRDTHYIHDGYETFVNELVSNGYKMVWLTMRSMSMYNFSKKYINKYVKCEGALIPEPEQFFPSLKKQILKETRNIKTNMLKKIRDLFPESINPFAGGLGNRENDALAYLGIGIPKDSIYIIFENSDIMTLSGKVLKSYVQLHNEIEVHFPIIGENNNQSANRSTLTIREGNFQVRKRQSNLHQFFKDLEEENSVIMQ